MAVIKHLADQCRMRIPQRLIGLLWVAVVAFNGCRHDSGVPATDVARDVSPATALESPASQKGAEVNGGFPKQHPLDRDAELARAEILLREHDYEGAASTYRRVLLVEPDDFNVLFRLASVEAARGDLQKAVDLLDEIPVDDPSAGLPALGQSAEWCVKLHRYDEAERRYLQLIRRAPQAVPARRQLAQLLNRQGRRQEATVHIHELCRQGNIRHDELQSLITLNEAIYNEPTKLPDNVEEIEPFLPIQPGGGARFSFGEKNFQDVVTILEPIVDAGTAAPAMLALYGRAVAELQDDQRFMRWLSQTNQQTRELGDYWAAVGTFELSQRRFDTATRALAEAIDRNPTDYLSIGRIRQCLSTLGDDDLSKLWADRWLAIRVTAEAHTKIVNSDPLDPDAIAELASLLFHMNRPLEAALWKSIEAFHRGLPKSEMMRWNAERQKLVATGSGFPSQSDRLCGMELSRYPLPNLDFPQPESGDSNRSNSNAESAMRANFRNIAQEIGLNHTYFVASRPQQMQYSIYQTLGGGVAVLDYDMDGAVDLYFAQGGADPPSYAGEFTNQLFRQVDSMLLDVTQVSDTVGMQYTIGVTAGDWNQDGFPDLVISNIGINQLLINNGDGTFSQRDLSDSASTTLVPASVAMADITGDHIPDIIQSVYVDDAQIGVKPPLNESGRVIKKVSPGDFEMGTDWLIENDGAGHFKHRTFDRHERSAHPGLGVIVTDLVDHPGNEVFVGNDLYPNQLWIRDPENGGWSDAASVLGCAFGFSGLATGSMGLAAGDFDSNGTLDIHVTNFENEHASLFMGEEGAYRDKNVHYQLAEPSRPLVGFGTQTIDYDNDGDLDLVVTNGHLDDSLDNSSLFKQPAQLFCNLGDKFQIAEVDDASKYWIENHLGRGLARLDFDRDGANDFVITHIGEPSALLLNKTRNDQHWLQLQLVGKKSERDSIGARIQIRYGGQEKTEWVIAGDGYLSRNEAIVSFGLGNTEIVDEILILWPSGEEQIFHAVAANQRLLVVESQDDLFKFDPVESK